MATLLGNMALSWPLRITVYPVENTSVIQFTIDQACSLKMADN